MKTEPTVGDKVRLVTEEGSFEGVVHLIEEELGKIMLTKAISVSTGERLGFQCFFKDDIHSLLVLGEKPKPAKKEEPTPFEIKRTASTNRMKNSVAESDLPKSKCGNIGVLEPDQPETTCFKHKDRPEKYHIIDELNQEFNDAISYIKHESIIGLSVEGIEIGRRGTLCWLMIGTTNYVFLFDMLEIGREFFDEGIRDIMESKYILKVIHDCRQISDCFRHQYIVELVNVYDTQVADNLVFRQVNVGSFNRNVRSLSVCLSEYLRLTPNEIYFPRSRTYNRKEGESIWKERPLPEDLCVGASKEVMYLRELRLTTMQYLLSELVSGVDNYLKDLRDADDEKLALFVPHKLPESFQQSIQDSRGRRPNTSSNFGRVSGGFKDNSIQCVEPNVYFSRDSHHKFPDYNEPEQLVYMRTSHLKNLMETLGKDKISDSCESLSRAKDSVTDESEQIGSSENEKQIAKENKTTTLSQNRANGIDNAEEVGDQERRKEKKAFTVSQKHYFPPAGISVSKSTPKDLCLKSSNVSDSNSIRKETNRFSLDDLNSPYGIGQPK